MLLLSRRSFILFGSIVLVSVRYHKSAYASAEPSAAPSVSEPQEPVLLAQDTGGMSGGDPGGGMGSGGSDTGGGMGGSSGSGSSSNGSTSSGMGGSGSGGGMNGGSGTGSGNTRGSRNDGHDRYEWPTTRNSGKKKRQNLLCLLQGTC